MTMNKHMDLISTLAMSQTMPTKQISVKVTLKCGVILLGVSYSLEKANILLNTAISVIRCPLESIYDIVQTENIVYPELPPGYNTPDKSASMSWTINNLRAIFQEVNTVSMVQYGYSVVATVDIDTGVSLTMSGFWSTLPVYIRHRFLEVLWYKYLTMLECYNAPSKYKRIFLWAYDNALSPIGIRTGYKFMVRDGVTVIFKSGGV